MEKCIQMLRLAPVFRCLDEKQQNDLATLALEKKYPRGQFIAHYGDTWPKVFIIASGEIHIQKFSIDGRSLGTIWMHAGDVFWSPTIFDGSTLPAALEVKKDCKIFLWEGEQAIGYVRSNLDAMWEMCQLLVQRIRQASQYVEELAFKPVIPRVAQLLLNQFENQPDGHIQREISLDEMSTMIGTTPVMVCKAISSLAAQGVIQVGRKDMTLLDRQGLKRISAMRE